ncbi:YlbF family regulator [Syntrophomonas palmitatica]|uniref:YlbF family regulator n=1 Tax=Syntrophomonas palmitatica TaxID=402877 RepID=UPI0006D220B0|nr:YlbF family regulator [Syntrophomonas palmitatica]
MTAADPYDKAHELAQAIMNSDIYRNYLNAKEDVEKNLEIMRKILVLREHQMEINRAQVMGQSLPENKLRDVAIEHAQLCKEPGVADFFEAERAFIKLYNDLMEIIHESVGRALQD